MATGNNVFGKIKAQVIPNSIANANASVRDLFLHALFARFALTNNDNVEFETRFDPRTNTIELIIPDNMLNVFDQMVGMQRGPKFKCFINWLIGSDTLTTSVISSDTDTTFISAGNLDIWTGATIGNLDNEKLIYYLPTSCLSVLGYNTKLDSSFSGQLRVSLVWVYDSGDPTSASFDIQTTVNVNEIGGNTIATVSSDTNISTFNLIKGDIRETELITVNNIQPDDLIALTIKRNYDGSPDPGSELIGVIGLKVEPITS